MVFEPPRHGKSEEVSRLFPAHYLYKHPKHHFGITSYGADMAYGLSRDARDNYISTGATLSESAEGMVEWHTKQGGRCWSAGVGGAITGKGGHVLEIDDPFKDAEEAYSLLRRNKVWEWYQHVFYTRLEPNGAIIIVLTRWHDDDLAGRILNEEQVGENPEQWHIISFEAIKEESAVKFPASCTIEPDWRSPGEALCTERYSLDRLQVIKTKVGDRAWRSLYQQNPIAEGGNIWKLIWFKKFDDTIFNQNGQSIILSNDGWDWDTNDGGDREDGENAANAGIRSSIGNDGNVYITDARVRWNDFADQVGEMKKDDSPHYVEAKASGRSITSALMKAGVWAGEVKVRGMDKVSRTRLVTPLAEQGKVFIHVKVWDMILHEERQGILGFPAREFKDLNDAFVQALNRHYPFTPEPEKKEPVYTNRHDYMVNEVMNKITNEPKRTANL